MKSKTHTSTNNGIVRTAARLMLCMMMAIAMIMPTVAQTDVFAAQTTGSDPKVQETAQSEGSDTKDEAKPAIRTSKTQNMSGMKLVFTRKVMSDDRLSMAPDGLIATGKRNSIELSWTGVENPDGILGYIILRHDPATDTWQRIAAVDKTVVSYTDEEAAEKNVLYSYTVVAYAHVDGKTKVSEPAEWAGALTAGSDNSNVGECKITNLADVVSVMAGVCTRPALKFDEKAYSTEMRWSSSNNAVATVDETGLITGVRPGTATISAKSHAGIVTSVDVHVTKPGSAQAMVDTFSAWMGYSRFNGNQNGIIDIYNSITPWPAGYRMRYSDAWCDATISAAAIKTGNVDKIGRECSVPRHVKIFQQLGIWEEDGTIVPEPGDIIVYSWRRFRQPNNASASHIGLVVKVEGNEITCIEGNRGIGVVDTRTIPVGWGCIRGYARPHYTN